MPRRPPSPPFGLVAEFDRPERLLEAARRAREAGFTRFETYSPFPIEGMAEAEGFHEPWVGVATLAGGIAGAVGGYLMQVYASLDFPLHIGGRPLVAPQAFALIVFELAVLGAATCGVLAMLLLNRLPRLSHPLFELELFHLASLDRFFLVIESRDPRFDKAQRFLKGLGARRVDVAEAAR